MVGGPGYPVMPHGSPLMHNAVNAEMELGWVDVPVEVRPEALETAIAGVSVLGMRVVNMTRLHMLAIRPCQSQFTPEALTVGSVQTISITPERPVGYSTDGRGFLRNMVGYGYPVTSLHAAIWCTRCAGGIGPSRKCGR